MVNTDKYKNDGWGLSKKEFDLLYEELSLVVNVIVEYNIVEFGSGRSTEFLLDIRHYNAAPIKIYSFDDSEEYAFKGSDENLELNIVPLVECSDDNWNKMFKEKKYDSSLFPLKQTTVHTRQKNTFYKIEDSMLPDKIDMLIVDGPHGNGRSLAFLRCFDRLKIGSKVLIDDASHYPFYEHLRKLRSTKILYEQHIKENKWENGGDFILCEITN
jgi:hypothetical protein